MRGTAWGLLAATGITVVLSLTKEVTGPGFKSIKRANEQQQHYHLCSDLCTSCSLCNANCSAACTSPAIYRSVSIGDAGNIISLSWGLDTCLLSPCLIEVAVGAVPGGQLPAIRQRRAQGRDDCAHLPGARLARAGRAGLSRRAVLQARHRSRGEPARLLHPGARRQPTGVCCSACELCSTPPSSALGRAWQALAQGGGFPLFVPLRQEDV